MAKFPTAGPRRVHVVDASVIGEKSTTLTQIDVANILHRKPGGTFRIVGVMLMLTQFPAIFAIVPLLDYKVPAARSISVAIIILVALAWIVAWFVILPRVKKMEAADSTSQSEIDNLDISALSPKDVAIVRNAALKFIADENNCTVGWPALENIGGANFFTPIGGRLALVDPGEFSNKQWVVDPSDSKRFFHRGLLRDKGMLFFPD